MSNNNLLSAAGLFIDDTALKTAVETIEIHINQCIALWQIAISKYNRTILKPMATDNDRVKIYLVQNVSLEGVAIHG
jgi:hypothetical protein